MNKPVIELSFISESIYNDPFGDIELTVEVLHIKSQTKWSVPAFWDGDNIWKARIYTPLEGEYTALSFATNEDDRGLHHVKHTFFADKASLQHPLYQHGKLFTCKNRFVYEDGKDFFWFGDTWWMALSDRLPLEDFEVLLEDRKAKGFSVIQLVGGLFPDMDSFDERGKNEGGFAWEADYERINPEFFKYADIKIEKIIDAGMIPFIFGAWGYYLLKMGAKKMQHHWRYLIARYAAYPVLWSVAGEMSMPWYLSHAREQEHQELKEQWDHIARYIKKVDPYKRLLSSHPVEYSFKEVKDSSVLDFEMLQAGHSDKTSIKKAIVMINETKRLFPFKPVVMDEISYEGILGKNKQQIQRMAFWISFLCGADGFTYGVNGIWQVNQEDKPFGNSPNGNNWGDTSWKEAMNLSGGSQIAKSIALLQRLSWQNLEPEPFLEDAFCKGYEDKIKVLYSFKKNFLYRFKKIRMGGLQIKKDYTIYYFDPVVAKIKSIFTCKTDKKGVLRLPRKKFANDWVLIVSLKELSL